MADLFGNTNDGFNLEGSGSSDKLKAEEIQKVIMMEQQKAQLNAQVKFFLTHLWYSFFFLFSYNLTIVLDSRN